MRVLNHIEHEFIAGGNGNEQKREEMRNKANEAEENFKDSWEETKVKTDIEYNRARADVMDKGKEILDKVNG